MKLGVSNSSRRERGFLLIECIVYIGMFFVIIGLAFALFEQCWDNAKWFRRNADEIVGTVRAGEQWRDDVRAATARLHTENLSNSTVLHIPQKHGEVSYRFADSVVSRRASQNADWNEVLPKVTASRMETDKRAEITAWRWEIELNTHRNNARMKPLFTFEAVAPHQF